MPAIVETRVSILEIDGKEYRGEETVLIKSGGPQVYTKNHVLLVVRVGGEDHTFRVLGNDIICGVENAMHH